MDLEMVKRCGEKLLIFHFVFIKTNIWTFRNTFNQLFWILDYRNGERYGKELSIFHFFYNEKCVLFRNTIFVYLLYIGPINGYFTTISGHFFRQLLKYLSQKWGSDGHFEVLHRSKPWLIQKLWLKILIFPFLFLVIL